MKFTSKYIFIINSLAIEEIEEFESRLTQEDRKKLNEVWLSPQKDFFDQSKYLTLKGIFVSEVSRSLIEILDSLTKLENIQAYLGVKSPTKKVGDVEFLRYNIENYLHEIYLLKERLKKHVNIINKSYQNKSVKKKTTLLKNDVEKVFKSYVHKRNLHVHDSRYYEHELSRLETLELLKETKDYEYEIKNLRNISKYFIKYDWKNTTKEDLKKINMYLDKTYFKVLEDNLIKDGQLIYPQKILQ